MTRRIGIGSGGALALALVACGTPDNGGIDVTFGPPLTSAPVTTIGAESSSTDAEDSSSTGDAAESTTDPTAAPTTDPSTTADPTGVETTTESGSDETTGGVDASVECLGLDQATCMITLGCGWPMGVDLFGIVVNGPCAFHPIACPQFDPITCATSPACFLDPGTQVCTGLTCDLLDELTCPTIFGCQWFSDMMGGGVCFAGGAG